MVLADKLDKVLAQHADDRQVADYHAHFVETSRRPLHNPRSLGPAKERG